MKLNSKGDIQWYENTSAILNLAIVSPIFKPAIVDSPTLKLELVFLIPPIATVSPILVKTDSNNNTQWIENLPYSGPSNY